MRNIERRACRRFAVPGASVAYRAGGRWPFRRGAAEEGCLLIDLSRGGVAFLALRPLGRRTRLELEILVPGETSPLVLRGRVVWSWVQRSGSRRVGVEFEPYGEVTGANAPATLERIAALEARLVEEGP